MANVKNDRRKLTTKDLERVFGVSSMTLYLWRQGTPTKTKLPTAPQKRGERGVAYYEDAILKWAGTNEVVIVVHPSRIKQPAVRKQPGPRARLAA